MKQWLKNIRMLRLSIKTLTLTGFGLVALPLVMAFLYSANQVNKLSHQGTSSIFNVAELVEVNRQVSQIQARLERFAGQFAVLKEPELLVQYQQQRQIIEGVLQQDFNNYDDKKLAVIAAQYLAKLIEIDQLLHLQPVDIIELNKVQTLFRQLSLLSQQLSAQSNLIINRQASNMESFALQVQKTMLLSLLIIPLTLVIAGVFFVLITRPLKLLLSKIKKLEQGRFQSMIKVKGSREVEEIADALELMRSRLHALELQKSSFIRHISHELKTPLAAIREGTELIYDNSVGELNNDQKEIADIIRTSVSRLQTLIEDLLDFNIVLDSTSLQDAQYIDLQQEVEQALELRVLDLKRKQIQVVKHVGSISLQCNRKQFSVILDNLLSNAIKFSPDLGVINIHAQLNQQTLELTVTDQGPGIIEPVQHKIFDAFYQGSAGHNSPIKSSGLGLTIVKELLMRLNGSITVKSDTKVPSFTSFIVRLPKAQIKGSTHLELEKNSYE